MYTLTYTYDYRVITLTTEWEDGGAPAGTRPGTAAYEWLLELYREGELFAGAKPIAIYDSSKPNLYTVKWIVPRASKGGAEYSYTVGQKKIDKYNAGTVNGDMGNGFRIINTYYGPALPGHGGGGNQEP